MANRLSPRQQVAKLRKRHPSSGKFIPQSGNGHNQGPQYSTPIGYSSLLERTLRPQAAFRWILPNVAAITPQYVQMVQMGSLAGNHVQQWELFELMFDNWATLTSVYEELVSGVTSKKIVFEPHHDEDSPPEPDAIERCKLVSSALRTMKPATDRDENDFTGVIEDLLDGWVRGFTVQEIVWEYRDIGELGTVMAPKATFWVHPVCYGFNMDGQIGLRTVGPEWRGDLGNYGSPNPPIKNPYPLSYLSAQPQPAVLQAFPDNKFLVGIHKRKSGTALSGPLLRPLVWWWVAANYSADWLLNLAQLFGIPFRWATYDPNAPDDTINKLNAMLQNMGSAGWASFPDKTTLEMKDVGSGRAAEYTPQGTLMDRADRYCREVILGQTMTGNTMTSGKGGQAFGVVEKDVKQERIDAAGKYCCDVINKQLIRSILLLNYGDDDNMPTVRLLEENEGQFVDAQRDQILKNIGLPLGVDFMRKKYGIPEPADGEEVLQVTQPEPPGTLTPELKFGEDGLPIQPNEFQPGMEQGDKAMQSASGAYAPGHEFYGNRYTKHAAEMSVSEVEQMGADFQSLRRESTKLRANPAYASKMREHLHAGFDQPEERYPNESYEDYPSEIHDRYSKLRNKIVNDFGIRGTKYDKSSAGEKFLDSHQIAERSFGPDTAAEFHKRAISVAQHSGRSFNNDAAKEYGLPHEKTVTRFPSITHSAENERRLLQNSGIQTKDAPQPINIKVEAQSPPVSKKFKITRSDGTILEGVVDTLPDK